VRVWRQLGSLATEVLLRPGKKAQARVQAPGFGERLFWSSTVLPSALSPETVALVREGKVLLDWERSEFSVKALGLGGGCCKSVPVPPPQSLPALLNPPPVDPQPVLAPEFLLIYETEAPSKPYRNLFRDLLTEENYTPGFLQRNISFLCSRSKSAPVRDHEAISLLRKVLYRTYFASIKSPKSMSLLDSKALSSLIQDFSSQVQDSVDRTGLKVLQQGLEAMAKMQYQEEKTKEEIAKAFEIWSSGSSPTFTKLAIFDENYYSQNYFHGSLATEVNIDMVLKGQYADLNLVYVLLSKAVRSANEFALYLLDLLGDLLLDATTWSPAFTVLFEGNEEFRGLRAYLMNESNQALSTACESLYIHLNSASLPELQTLVSAALKAKQKSPPQYLFCPCQGEKAAILADVSLNPPSLRKVANEYFHSRSRVTFAGPQTAVITGVPTEENSKSANCFEVDLETLVLSQLPTLIQARYWHTADYYNGMVIVTGGKITKNAPSTKSVEGLSSKSAWTALDPLNYERDSHSSCVSGQALYVFAGVPNTELATSIEKFQAGSWTVLTIRLPFVVSLLAVGEIAPHTVLIAGGNNLTRERLCGSLDLETGSYADLPDLPEKSMFISGMHRSFDQVFVVLTQTYNLFKFEQSHWTSIGQYS